MAVDKYSHRTNSELWAVAAYFNPVGFESRLRNYRIFREHLNVPLVTVELAYGGDFELDSGDADILIQIRDGDILWQKERLLNIAIERTPESCDSIVWIDCDIVFQQSDWADLIRESLIEHKLLQPFRRVYQTQPTNRGLTPLMQCRPRDSLPALFNENPIPADVFLTQGASKKWMYSSGHVWAGRREILLEHGLYDALIMGSGDKAIAAAAFGRFNDFAVALDMNDSTAKHYLNWAAPFYDSVQGKVGFVDLEILHLWHGDLAKRKYDSRYKDLTDFDPYRDIAMETHGAWKWCSAKREIHDLLTTYFRERDEDGRPPKPGS